MIVIGLTGGIAAGKSHVARFFEEAGIPVVHSDQLAREAVLPGTR
ncbi:MAG: dephospho-CoA kinase, partial [Nitrospiraceae bacterium]|nr:dephospho-CoA kinase [Nitrospiraceae bacterium]